jgi:hypothetical protein
MGLRDGANQYWGWGANYYGQIGNGTNGYGATQPVPELIQFCTRCERCVQLGTTGSFTAQCSGTLVLYFNDYQYDFDTESYGFDDNGTNSFTVTIGSITTNVPGNAAWGVAVGTVTNGGVYTYSASGFCARDEVPHLSNPDGNDPNTNLVGCSSINATSAICPTLKCFSLVGKIQ